MNWAALQEFSLWLSLNAMVLLGLLQAVVLLDRHRQEGLFARQSIVTGLLTGLVGILLIRFSFTLASGAIFDARSVLLAIAGLFFGTVPTLIAMTMTAVYRAVLGGTAALTGVGVIVASGLLGLAWRRALGRPPVEIGWGQLYALGLTVHGVMLALMLLLPWNMALQVLSVISLPVLLLLPLMTVAGGAILIDADRHRQAEASLREERGRLANILWGTGVGTWEWNVQTGALRINERWAGMLGYRLEELEPVSIETWTRLVHPEDMTRSENLLARHFDGETDAYECDARMRHRDGRWVWILDRGKVVSRDAAGRPEWMTGTHTDIAARKAAEAMLALQARRSEAMLELPQLAEQLDERAFMQHALGVMEGLTDSCIAFMHFVGDDQDTLELAAWSAATLERHCRAAYQSHYPVSQAGIWADAVRRRAPVVCNDYAAHPGKRVLPEGHAELRRVASVPVVAGGCVRMLAGVGNKDSDYSEVDVETLRLLADETWRLLERRRDERALQQSEERNRRMLDNMPDMLFVNHDDRIAYVNRAGVQLLKAAGADELLGRSIYDLFSPDYHPQIRQRIARLRAAPGTRVEAAREDLLARDGSRIEAEVGATSFASPGGVDVEVIVRDISTRLRAERELQEVSGRYIEELNQAVLGTADAVSRVIELRDPYTAGHERRVGELAAAIAEELGLDDHVQRGLRIAGAMHDVGKVIVPVEILSKPSRLNAAEFELIKLHAEQGYQILKDVNFPWPVAEVARQHHERIDGSGYPRALKGEAILLEARIMAVADVVESMASHRPYRPAVGLDQALDEIERNAGRLYDAAAATACLRLFRERSWDFQG